MTKTNKCYIMAALEIKPKAKDAWLADQHTNLAILKINGSLAFMIVGISATHLNSTGNACC